MKKPSHQIFVLVAPRFTYKSAGVQTIYKLAEHLSNLGKEVYIVSPFFNKVPNYKIRVLNFIEFLFKWSKLRYGTVIYYESIKGNPLQIEKVTRYLLNVPGVIRSPKYKFEEEDVWSYSKEIALQSGVNPEKILYIPVSDPDFFNFNTKKTNQVPLVYLGKYSTIPKDMPSEYVMISRFGKNSPNRYQLKTLLEESVELHVWENTALALEATLCGCIVVFHLNEEFTTPFALDELSTKGYAYHNDANSIEKAKIEVKDVRANYEIIWRETSNRTRNFLNTSNANVVVKTSFAKIRPPLLYGLIGRLINAYSNERSKGICHHLLLALKSRIDPFKL